MSVFPATIRHFYVHVPYCDGKCLYCAFFSENIGGARPETALEFAPLPPRELALWLRGGLPAAPDTIYFGGGTPAALGVDGLQKLIAGVLSQLPRRDIPEITVELTPQLATKDMLLMLRRLGANRISMGAQCFDDNVLRAMRRRHTAADTIAAVGRIREAGFTSFGLDLIAGLPGLDAAGWRRSVARAIDLDLPHLSVYALTVEEGSALAAMARQGMPLPGDEALLTALAQAADLLEPAGYERYEISNYARQGHECRHNLAYWRGDDYLGLGPAASSRLGSVRRTNHADIAAYAAAVKAGEPPPATEEELSPEEDMTERFIFNLRLAAGVETAAFVRRFPMAAALAPRWQAKLAKLAAGGMVSSGHDGRWRLTTRGLEVADAVCGELAGAF